MDLVCMLSQQCMYACLLTFQHHRSQLTHAHEVIVVHNPEQGSMNFCVSASLPCFIMCNRRIMYVFVQAAPHSYLYGSRP